MALTLRLTLTVTYTPNGVPSSDLIRMLRFIADHAAGEGLMTGYSPAEVDDWKARVEEISEDINE